MTAKPSTLRRKYFLAVPVAVYCCLALAEEPAPRTQNVMQAKLAHTRNLIEALVANDFETLSKQAEEMAAVTRLAAWSKNDSPAYQAESFEFENKLHLLRELAQKENTRGAALACVTLTLNCVDCHQTMRANGQRLGDIRVPAVNDQAPNQESTRSPWMRQKLERTEQALAGLVAEDFAAIEEAAASMKNLAKVEAWSRRKAIPRYDMLMFSFNYACEEMEMAATEKNIESATLAYAQLLMSCVNCHGELETKNP